MTFSMLIGLLIILPVIGAIAILITGKKENLRESMSFIAAFSVFGVVLKLLNTTQFDGQK